MVDIEPAPRIPQALRDEVFENIQRVVKNVQNDEQSLSFLEENSIRDLHGLSVEHCSRSSSDEQDNSPVSREQLYPDPQTWLSTSRRDSFQAPPVELDHEGQRLVDHCTC